jgi:hypothetical protein
MLEILYDTRARLLVWNGKKARIVERFRYADQVFVPASIDSSTAQAIRFPAEVMSFGSTRVVFDAIRGAADQYFGLPDEDLQAISYWVLSSWFPELLTILTTLIITGGSHTSTWFWQCPSIAPLSGMPARRQNTKRSR